MPFLRSVPGHWKRALCANAGIHRCWLTLRIPPLGHEPALPQIVDKEAMAQISDLSVTCISLRGLLGTDDRFP